MATGKVIVFLGSPRKQGYTATLACEVGRGAEKAGLEVKEYYLHLFPASGRSEPLQIRHGLAEQHPEGRLRLEPHRQHRLLR